MRGERAPGQIILGCWMNTVSKRDCHALLAMSLCPAGGGGEGTFLGLQSAAGWTGAWLADWLLVSHQSLPGGLRDHGLLDAATHGGCLHRLSKDILIFQLSREFSRDFSAKATAPWISGATRALQASCESPATQERDSMVCCLRREPLSTRVVTLSFCCRGIHGSLL